MMYPVMRELVGGVTAAQEIEQVSLEVERRVIDGAEGVSIAQKVETCYLAPSPMAV